MNLRGWLATSLSTTMACFWAFWGTVEAFHEGWWRATLGARLLQTLAYLGPALGIIALSLLALTWPKAGSLMLLGLGLWLTSWFCRHANANFNLLGPLGVLFLPLLLLAALYAWGRPEPLGAARLLVAGLPLLVMLVSAIEPVWRVAHRVDDGDRGERVVVGNGLTLTWAPAGPGWVRDARHACNWAEAARRCAHLSADGQRLEAEPQGYWRLPTTDEVVRSMTRGGVNAGGVWDAAAHRATYRRRPDKESPLWDSHAETIYWWSADEAEPQRAWRVTATGGVFAMPQRLAMGSGGFRAVRAR
jgi:hypothetical protein